MPPSSTGHIVECGARALLDFGDHLVREIGVGAAEIEQEIDLCSSPVLPIGAQIEFERPGVARLAVQHPIGVRRRIRGFIN